MTETMVVKNQEQIVIGALVVDRAARQVRIGDRKIELTSLQFEVLTYLAENPGICISREKLYEACWDFAAEPDGLRMVDIQVSRVRQQIGFERIKTIRGHGYRLEVVDACRS